MTNFNQELYIGDTLVSDVSPTYVIAEIGSNHNQSLEKAKEMIDIAADCGADAAKFQSLNFNALYKADKTTSDIKELFKLIELSEDWYSSLSKYCSERNIHFMSAPTYLESVKLLANANSPAFKIASPQFDLFPEITLEAKKYHLPMLMSVGLSNLSDIDKMMELCIEEEIRNIVLLHCVSQYPTPAANANLSFIQTLKANYNCLVGYSDHTLGTHFPISAVALGASVIEKHFTLDRTTEGPDHHFACEPKEFKQMVEQIREIKSGMGNGRKAPLTDWEKGHRERIKMKFVTKRALAKGEKFSKDNFILQRAEGGIAREHLALLEQFTIETAIAANEVLNWHHITKANKGQS